MRQKSTKDFDGIDWVTVPLPLGVAGLDLRRPDDPSTMSRLLNARFLDAKTVERRGGHTGRIVQDQSAFNNDKVVTDEWVYGHGTVIEPTGDEARTNVHHPIHVRGGGTFHFGDTDVVWTGDRLLVMAADGPAYGSSSHWGRDGSDTAVKQGIPAYLPVQVDSVPAAAIDGDYMDTCLTEAFRVVVSSTSDDRVLALVTNRETGIVVWTGFIDDNDGAPVDLRVVNSGGYPLALWCTAAGLSSTSFGGTSWSEISILDVDAVTFDVAVTANGCHIAYRDSAFAIRLGQFASRRVVDLEYTFGTALALGDAVATAAVAIAVSVDGALAVVWESDGTAGDGIGLSCQLLTPSLGATTLALNPSEDPFNGGLAVCFRQLTDENEQIAFVVHAGQEDVMNIYEVLSDGNTASVIQSDILYNTQLASRSFRVGDEVFAWMRTTNSSTHYLAAGVYKPNICGYADRETALERAVANGNLGLGGVTVDPLEDGSVLTWVRPFNAGTYSRPGDALIGDIDFLPELSTAVFGKSTYLASSNCRNWDGKALGDAGFHDFPIGSDDGGSVGAGSKSLGFYQVRVYPVRYNALGERFQGVAITSDPIELTGSDNTIVVTISTIPCTNHDDVKFEVYCTSEGPGAFFLETTVDNDRDAATVTATLVLADAVLELRPADPHATTVGGLNELEESAPLGCATLITAGDRLWGIGGQVPAGVAQYSKLFEAGEGAGFSATEGTQIIDATGNILTSIGSVSDTRLVVFQTDKLYVITESGPNNYGVGSFGVPQLEVVSGAISHAGTIALPVGLVFWGAGGPRLLSSSFQALVISEAVEPLTKGLTPSGVRVDTAHSEVVWYTADGTAVLWNYANGSRWAEWSGLPVAGCSQSCLVTTDGRLLTPAEVDLDDGRRFSFTLATGFIRPEQVMASHTLVRSFAFSGEFNGQHQVQFKVYYNGSSLWSDKFKWAPTTDTWLTAGTEFETMTPEDIDALGTLDQSGSYFTKRRMQREDCRFFRIEMSDCGEAGFTPYELAFELGLKPGLGRAMVNTFTK